MCYYIYHNFVFLQPYLNVKKKKKKKKNNVVLVENAFSLFVLLIMSQIVEFAYRLRGDSCRCGINT
jgi:hypothetical protein